MKKALTLLLSLALCLTLCACGKSKAAQAVDDMIMEIGEVSLDSKSLIEKADNELRILSQEDREQVENTAILENAKTILQNLQDNADAKAIDDAINSIGEVTLNSESAIQNASRLYKIASENAQNKVTNFSTLEQAIETLSALKVQKAVDSINNIGDVSLDSQDDIKAAKAAYNVLTIAEQKQVENADVLKQADEKLLSLQQEERERRKEQALSNMKSRYDKVRQITWYQPEEFPEYINNRCFILPYIGVSPTNTWLRLQINYTGDTWIFYDQVIISIDGVNYTKTFEYGDILRDNNTDVWETADFNPTSSDIDMLKSVADSNETIVRFQGDHYQYYDFTVRDSDKTAIKNVLTAYDALKNS